MMPKPVYAIVAVAANRVIGAGGRLPWDFPSDSAYFREMTRGGVMIEGPLCYEELGGALPDRGTVVVSRRADAVFPGAACATSPAEALATAAAMPWAGPVWICGGQWLYEAMLPSCDRLYVTEIGASYTGDRYFPDWRPTHPRLLSVVERVDGGVPLRFCVYAKS